MVIKPSGTTPLPTWPPRTIAVLATVTAEGPHVIPVFAPVRANENTILLSLHRTRDSVARLRDRPEVALVVLAEGNIAFTARGIARVVADPMARALDYASVEIAVTDFDDDELSVFALAAERVDNLERLATLRRRCRAAAFPSA